MKRKAFDDQVFELCRQIPRGHVMTYGLLAAHIPPPANIDPVNYDRIKARWVGYALNRCPEDVPWHRIINARGEISVRPGKRHQRALLEDEGIVFDLNGRVNLKEYAWMPGQRSKPPAAINRSEDE